MWKPFCLKILYSEYATERERGEKKIKNKRQNLLQGVMLLDTIIPWTFSMEFIVSSANGTKLGLSYYLTI